MTADAAAKEDADMRALMEKFDADMKADGRTVDTSSDDVEVEEDDCEVMDPDEVLEKYRRTVTITDNALDHVVLGTSDLAQSLDDFEKMTGVRPVMVVSHNGLGTKSARVAFKDCSFIEIIGPDPKQSSTEFSEKISKIASGKMVAIHYAVRRNDATTTLKRETLPELGFTCDHVTIVAKDKGLPWMWDNVFLQGHNHGGLLPFFIQWRELHAAAKLPIVGSLDKVIVSAPSGHAVHKVLDGGIDNLTVKTGGELFEFTFSSSKGSHTFSESSPIGITFPEEGGLPLKQSKLDGKTRV